MSTDHERDRTDRLVAGGIDRLIGIGERKRAIEALNKGRSELKPATLERLEVALGLRRAAIGRVIAPPAAPAPLPLAPIKQKTTPRPAVSTTPLRDEPERKKKPFESSPVRFGEYSLEQGALPQGVSERQMVLLNGFAGTDLLVSAVEFSQLTGCSDYAEIERELAPVLSAMNLKVRPYGNSYAIVPLDR